MTIQGADRMLARLDAIPAYLTEAVRVAMEKNASEIVGLMRRLAPKESGALAKSINWTWGDAPAGTIRLGTVRGGRKGGAVYGSMKITIFAGGQHDGADAFYARFQEFGTRKMRANPFFFPAYRALRKKAGNSITRAARKAIKENWGS